MSIQREEQTQTNQDYCKRLASDSKRIREFKHLAKPADSFAVGSHLVKAQKAKAKSSPIKENLKKSDYMRHLQRATTL